MTPDAFRRWLAEMKSAGLASSQAEIAEKLGADKNSVTNWKIRPAPYHVSLACRALLEELEPYE